MKINLINLIRTRIVLPGGIALAGFAAAAHAAVPDTLTDSRTLLLKGIRLHDEGDYKGAMSFYTQIPEGDTNYVLSLHERAVSSLADSNWEETKKICRMGLAVPGRPSQREFLLLLGHAHDYLGEHDAAFRCYDSIGRTSPFSYQPHYEKAASFLLRKDYDAALHYAQRSAMLNPGHFRTHYNIANALLAQGRPVEAYLAASFCLFHTADKGQAFLVIGLQDRIQKQTNELREAWQKRDVKRADPAFEEANDIINSKLALSPQYRYKSVLSGDGTINVLHAILEKITYDPADTNFVMQYYVPLMKQAYDDGDFDPMVLHMYSGYGLPTVEAFKRKQSGAVKDFARTVNEYTQQLVSTGVLNYRERQQAARRYAFVPSEDMFVEGGLRSTDPLLYNEGPVRIYLQGALFAEGSSNAAGKREGEWKIYHPNGRLKSREQYKNGLLSGPAEYFRSNGTQSFAMVYGPKEEVLEKTEYTAAGAPESTLRERGGYGEVTAFNDDGSCLYKCKLVKGKIQDPTLRTTYPDGGVASEITLADGKRNGVARLFHRDGTRSEEASYKDNERDGSTVTYHRNGKVSGSYQYRNGKLDGPYEEYNNKGQLVERGTYSRGRKTGIQEFLTSDGRVFGTIEYRKDAPKSYRFVSDSGKVNAGGMTGDLHRLVQYYADGTKRSEQPLRDGKTQGEVRLWNHYGGLRRQYSFVEDQAEGKDVLYHQNGRVSYECSNSAGAGQGWYTGWTDAGTKTSEGFLSGGDKAGKWVFYYPNGKPETEAFYDRGEVNGPYKTFDSKGRVVNTRWYDHGRIVALMEYDSSGKELFRQDFPDGTGVYEEHTAEGKVRFRTTLARGEFHGEALNYFPNGTVQRRAYYRYGTEDSAHASFYPTGKPAATGLLRNGKREGKWINYDVAGNVDRVLNYVGGEQHGPEELWANGMLFRVYSYSNGDRNGRDLIYGDKDKLCAVLNFDEGVLRSYAVVGPDGKEGPAVPVVAGTAHIRAAYPDGKPALDMSFSKGLLVGSYKRWYSNGQPAHDYNYNQEGDREGTFVSWWPNGQKSSEMTYSHDVQQGPERFWDEKGRLVNAGERDASGQLHGTDTYTDPATGQTTAIRYDSGFVYGMN